MSKKKKERPLSPHQYMSKDELREYRKQQRKEAAISKREATQWIYNLSDEQLKDFCNGCNKSCPCEDGLIRDRLMYERKLIDKPIPWRKLGF